MANSEASLKLSFSSCSSPHGGPHRRGAIAQCSSTSDRCEDLVLHSTYHQQRRNGICVLRDSELSDYHSRLTAGDAEIQCKTPMMLSEAELTLLDGLQTEEGRQRQTGNFLTLRKRSRKFCKKHSLCEETNDQGLFEEVYQKQTMRILSQISRWDFNTFALDSVTAGRPLPTLLLHLFHHYDLIKTFNLDVVKVWKCFAMIEDGYHSKNPYHNAVHATDVTQAMHCFLQESLILDKATSMELMSSLLAAVTHDLDHPGVNQPFLIATSNHLAALYKNSSVLENHHWRSAVCCLHQSGMLDHFDRSQWEEITFHIRSLILATDITRQNEFLTRLKQYTDENTLNMSEPQYRHFILQIALKCADICNPCRTWDISNQWSRQVCEEFFRQGDVERQLNLPVTPLCDRHNTSIAKIQTGFFRFVVTPLFEAWDQLLQTSLSSSLISNLRTNQKKWENMVVEEAEKQVSLPTDEINEVKQVEPIFDFSDVWTIYNGSRRHSVPVNFPHNNSIPLPSTQLFQSLYAQTNWAASFSTIAQNRLPKFEPCVNLAMNECRSLTVRSLVRQATFPPPQRADVGSSPVGVTQLEEEDAGTKCPNNGCGTSSESEEEIDANDVTATTDFVQPSLTTLACAGNERRRSLDKDIRLFNVYRKTKPLFRLKSDSDLTKYGSNCVSKLVIGGKIQLEANREEDEKENAEPEVVNLVSQNARNLNRKLKPQGVNLICSRLSGRRSSAPVGILKEEFGSVIGLQEPEVLQHRCSKRRDSAPITLISDGANRITRRVSLPSDLIVNSSAFYSLPLPTETHVTVPTANSIINTGSHNLTNLKTDKLNANLNIRRQSVPSDFGVASFKQTYIMDAVSQMPLKNLPSGIEHSLNHLNLPYKTASKADFIRQTQSFDATFLNENGGEEIKSISNLLKDLPRRKVMFPLHRRSSVPTEAWLFPVTSAFENGDEQHENLIVDLN